MCKTDLKNRDGNIYCKCKNRTSENLREFGIPSDWKGKEEIRKVFNVGNMSVDYIQTC